MKGRTQVHNINWVAAVFLLLTPLIAVGWGGMHIYSTGVRSIEVVSFLLYISATSLSVTAGYHRLFAHGAYECRRAVKVFYLLFGAAAFQHSVLSWASDHRRHHQHIDRDGDPYNIRRGFLWAHIGWLLDNEHKAARFANVSDLRADPLIRLQHRFYVPLAMVMGFGVPFGLGYALGHPWGCLLWAGVFRTVVGHHTTFLVNSLAHTLGKRPYTLAVSARDSFVTSLLTFGEGYHNFHHRFATDYRNGVRRYQWDPTKWLIRAMAAIGWAWDLGRAPRESIVAAQLQCETQRFIERFKDQSEIAIAYARQQITEIAALVERAAGRFGRLERELARARRAWGHQRRAQLGWLRAELRAARSELRQARGQWRVTLEALSTQSLPQPA